MKQLMILLVACTMLAYGCSDDEPGCTESTWYEDNDGDGKGNSAVSISACEQPEGYVADDSDDDDTGSGFTLTSIAISDGELLDEYKCEEKTNDIENSLPLAWSNVPESTGSLAIIMYHYPNPDDQSKAPNTYLILWDIDPTVTEIPYGEADDGPWYMGTNKDGTAVSYTSPCSPSAGTHEYTIKLYALSETPASLPEMSSIDVDWDVMQSAFGNVTIIEEASLVFSDVN